MRREVDEPRAAELGERAIARRFEAERLQRLPARRERRNRVGFGAREGQPRERLHRAIRRDRS